MRSHPNTPHLTKTHQRTIETFFLLAAAITALLGLGLLFMPAFVTNIFLDQQIEKSGLFFIRFAGTSLLGFSVLNFYVARREHRLLRLAALVNGVSLAPATVISIWTYRLNYIDHFQWLIVLEHGFFFTGFVWSWYALRDCPA
jgi:hypothetical protein